MAKNELWLLVFIPCVVRFHTDSGLGHGTVVGQWNISKYYTSRSVISAFLLGFVFWKYLLLEYSCHIVKKNQAVTWTGLGKGERGLGQQPWLRSHLTASTNLPALRVSRLGRGPSSRSWAAPADTIWKRDKLFPLDSDQRTELWTNKWLLLF